MSTRVVLVDDHAMFTNLLALQLEQYDDIDVVGCAATLAEAPPVATEAEAEVVVVDYRLPDGDGVELARALSECTPAPRLVMLTGYHDPRVVREAVAAGCVAFVTKDRGVEELVRAVRAAARGETLLAPEDLQLLSTAEPEPHTLTDREVDVVRLLAVGATTRQIAERLSISVNTVRNHVQSVLQKLGAHSRLEAVANARRVGVVDDDYDPR
jgi:DNA-binding NarL/FixJ family response regulator